jgi:hypothetical protein
MGFNVVSELLDLKPRKLLVEALDLLQAEHVGLNLLEVGEEVGQPLADGIDVPGCDAQAPRLLELMDAAICHASVAKGRARAALAEIGGAPPVLHLAFRAPRL